MEVGAMLCINDLEAIRDALNGWRVRTVVQRQARYSGLAADWAPKVFVPLIGHPKNIR
jgi:hypothetical protein